MKRPIKTATTIALTAGRLSVGAWIFYTHQSGNVNAISCENEIQWNVGKTMMA
jgi:hypothetical protein